MKTFPNIDWQITNRFAHDWDLSVDTARDILTYIIDNEVLSSDPYPKAFEEESDEYKRGWNDACEEIQNNFSTWEYMYSVTK